MYILSMQFPLGISPELRVNFDYIFLLADDMVSNLKRIHEHYAGIIGSFEVFKQIFSQLTADFGVMVIVNRGARASLSDKIFWYKANIIDSSTIYGHRQFKNFHNRNYNENWNKSNVDNNAIMRFRQPNKLNNFAFKKKGA